MERDDELEHDPTEEEEEEESPQGSDFSFLLEDDDRGEETPAEKAAREEAEEKTRVKAEEDRRAAEAARTPSLDQQTLDLLAEIKRNPEGLRRALTTPERQAETPAPLDVTKLTEELEADFLVDPKKAFGKLIVLGQQYMASQRQQAEQTVAQAGMNAADTTIESYMDKVKADATLDPDVIPVMQTIIDEAKRTNAAGIARSTAADIRKALDDAKATAIGKVYLKNGPPKPKVQTRSTRPPVYGSRGAAGGGRGAAPSRDDLPKNEAERSLVLGLREGGCSPKEIVASLREFRGDQGGPRTNRRAG